MGNYSSSCQAIAFQLQSFTHCLSVFEQLGRVLLYECTACRPVLSKTWPRHIFFLSCGQISEGTSPTCSEGCYFLSPGQNGNSSHMIWHQSIQTGIQIEMFRPILYVYFCRCIHDISMQIFWLLSRARTIRQLQELETIIAWRTRVDLNAGLLSACTGKRLKSLSLVSVHNYVGAWSTVLTLGSTCAWPLNPKPKTQICHLDLRKPSINGLLIEA